MLNALYDSYRVLYKVYSEGAFVKQALSEVAIEELNRAHTTKLVYGVLDKDIELTYYISVLCAKNPKQSIRIILKESMYAIKYLSTAPYAVVDNAVELTKKLGKGGTAGFVNAVLRKFVGGQIAMPSDKIERLSVEYSCPKWLLKRLIADYGEERTLKMLATDTERTLVRFNDGADGEKYLTEKRWGYEKTPFDNCFFVAGFKRDEDYDKGVYTFQSIGSVAICSVVEGGEKLLDACSAPGGKAVLLSSRFDSVTAFELHPHRVSLIESYAKRMKKDNVTAICRDSSIFSAEYCDKFDACLCDVPCSGTGVLKENPDIKLNRKDEDVNSLNDVQYKILSVCSKYVKRGGYLYYSTCSVLKEENSDIISKFLAENKDYSVETVECALPHETFGYGITFLPDSSLGAGFYVCKLKRS